MNTKLMVWPSFMSNWFVPQEIVVLIVATNTVCLLVMNGPSGSPTS